MNIWLQLVVHCMTGSSADSSSVLFTWYSNYRGISAVLTEGVFSRSSNHPYLIRLLHICISLGERTWALHTTRTFWKEAKYFDGDRFCPTRNKFPIQFKHKWQYVCWNFSHEASKVSYSLEITDMRNVKKDS